MKSLREKQLKNFKNKKLSGDFQTTIYIIEVDKNVKYE